MELTKDDITWAKELAEKLCRWYGKKMTAVDIAQEFSTSTVSAARRWAAGRKLSRENGGYSVLELTVAMAYDRRERLNRLQERNA